MKSISLIVAVLSLGTAPASAFDLPVDAFGPAFNAVAKRIGTDDRLTLEACVSTPPDRQRSCRYTVTTGASLIALAALKSGTTKAVLLKWTNLRRFTASYTWTESVLVKLLSPSSKDLDQIPVFRGTTSLLSAEGDQAKTATWTLQNTIYALRYDPKTELSLYAVDNTAD